MWNENIKGESVKTNGQKMELVLKRESERERNVEERIPKSNQMAECMQNGSTFASMWMKALDAQISPSLFSNDHHHAYSGHAVSSSCSSCSY